MVLTTCGYFTRKSAAVTRDFYQMSEKRDLHQYVEIIERFENSMLGGAAAELITFGILYLKEGHHLDMKKEQPPEIGDEDDRWISCAEVNERLTIGDRTRQRLLKAHGIQPRRGKHKGKTYLLSDIIRLKHKIEEEEKNK